MKRNILVGIDWQNDFVDPNGSLYVKNAEKSAERFAEFLSEYGKAITDISMTLDSHQPLDIAHPPMYIDKKGNHPSPFTLIDSSAIGRIWFPVREPWKDYVKEYTIELEKSNRFVLMIWPEHCLIGSPGHNLYPSVEKTIYNWERKYGKTVNFLTKGSDPFTEHYSAVRAEVPFMGGKNGYEPDPGTQTNLAWLNMLSSYDLIIFTGQALSHCVRFTLDDTITEFGIDQAKKIVIVRDMSDCVVTPDYDFTPETETWLDGLKKQGITVTTSQELPNLLR